MKEKLSAMLDGEISPAELSELLDEMHRSPELIKQWGRYVRIQSSLAGESGPDVADRVRAEIELEPAILAPNNIGSDRHPAVRKLVSGLAIAATVAGVAVGGLRWFTPGSSSTPPLLAQSPQQADYIRASGTRWKIDDPGLENDLNVYLVEHGGYAGSSNMNGVQAYVKVAGYDDYK